MSITKAATPTPNIKKTSFLPFHCPPHRHFTTSFPTSCSLANLQIVQTMMKPLLSPPFVPNIPSAFPLQSALLLSLYKLQTNSQRPATNPT